MTLEQLLKQAKEKWDAMSPEEQKEMLRIQGEGWAKAEVENQKLVKKTVNPDGSITYHDYQSYVLD